MHGRNLEVRRGEEGLAPEVRKVAEEKAVFFGHPAPDAVALEKIDVGLAPVERGGRGAASARAVDAVRRPEDRGHVEVGQGLVAEGAAGLAALEDLRERHVEATGLGERAEYDVRVVGAEAALELLLHVLDLCAQARDLSVEVLADLGYVLLEFATDFVGEAGDLPAQVLK